MKRFVILFALFALPALASSDLETKFMAVPNCGGPIAVQPNSFAITTNYRDVHLQTPTSIWTLQSQSPVKDLLLTENTLFVLRSDRIEEWDLSTGERLHDSSTLPDSTWVPQGGEARDMALWGDHVVIAHGRMGFSIYSINDHKTIYHQLVLQDQLPLESEITGVVVDGNEAIFVGSNYSLSGPWNKTAFRGFLIWDLANHQEKHRVTGVDPGSRGLLLQGNTLVVDFSGLYQAFDLKEVRKSNKAKIRRSVWQFPAQTRLLAGFDLKDSRIWSCVSQPADGGRRQIPLVLDSSGIGL